jgi:hypothetical protein
LFRAGLDDLEEGDEAFIRSEDVCWAIFSIFLIESFFLAGNAMISFDRRVCTILMAQFELNDLRLFCWKRCSERKFVNGFKEEVPNIIKTAINATLDLPLIMSRNVEAHGVCVGGI